MYVDKSKLAAGDPEPVYVYMICQECNKINKCAPKHRIERQAAESEKRLADDYSIYAAVKCNGLNAATEIVNDTLTARGGLKIPKILVDEFDDNDRIPK